MTMLKLIEAKRFEIEIQSILKVLVEESKDGSRKKRQELTTAMIHSTSIICGSQSRLREQIPLITSELKLPRNATKG